MNFPRALKTFWDSVRTIFKELKLKCWAEWFRLIVNCYKVVWKLKFYIVQQSTLVWLWFNMIMIMIITIIAIITIIMIINDDEDRDDKDGQFTGEFTWRSVHYSSRPVSRQHMLCTSRNGNHKLFFKSKFQNYFCYFASDDGRKDIRQNDVFKKNLPKTFFGPFGGLFESPCFSLKLYMLH